MMPAAPPATNWAEMKFYMDLVIALICALNFGYTWWTNREKVTSRRFAKLEEEVVKRATTAVTDILAQRTGHVESLLKNVPGCCTGHTGMEYRLDGHSKRIGQHKELIDQLAAEVKHLPKNADLEKIHHRVDEVFGVAQAIKGEIKGIAHNMSLILEAHLKER